MYSLWKGRELGIHTHIELQEGSCWGWLPSLIYRVNKNRGKWKSWQVPGIEPKTPGLCSQWSAAELYDTQTTTSPHNLLYVLFRWYWHAFSLFSYYNIFTPKWNKNSNRSLWTAMTRRSSELVYPSCVESHFKMCLQNVPYKDYNLLVLTSFEVATVTTMDSQEPTCCDDGHLLAS